MRSVGVVVDPPFFDDLASFVEIGKQMFVLAFVKQAAVDGEDGPAPSAPAIYWRWTNPLTGAIHHGNRDNWVGYFEARISHPCS